jgi:hypothetical protein
LRRAIIVLSKLTGWGLADILEMGLDDFWLFLEDGQAIQNEINEAARP